MPVPTGHVFRREGSRGPVWYAKYRLPDGRQVQKKVGPGWSERGRPPAGYFTKRTAEAWLRDVLDEARRGTLPGMVRTGATFDDAAAEWLRFIAEDRGRKPSTIKDYRSVLEHHLLPAFGSMQLEEVTPAAITGPPGPPGPPGRRGPAGPAPPSGPPAPGLNNFDRFITTAGAVNSVTVGSFTLSDANNPAGGGCTGIMLSVSAGTLVASGGPGWSFWTTDGTTGGTGQTSSGQTLGSPGDVVPGTVAITSGIQNNVFSAVVNNGSSTITGIVSDSTIENTGHGARACLDWGGLAGAP